MEIHGGMPREGPECKQKGFVKNTEVGKESVICFRAECCEAPNPPHSQFAACSFSPFVGLLKELLNSDHFVSVIMNNSRRGADSENAELLEKENPLPLMLKKVIAEGVTTSVNVPCTSGQSNYPFL